MRAPNQKRLIECRKLCNEILRGLHGGGRRLIPKRTPPVEQALFLTVVVRAARMRKVAYRLRHNSLRGLGERVTACSNKLFSSRIKPDSSNCCIWLCILLRKVCLASNNNLKAAYLIMATCPPLNPRNQQQPTHGFLAFYNSDNPPSRVRGRDPQHSQVYVYLLQWPDRDRKHQSRRRSSCFLSYRESC